MILPQSTGLKYTLALIASILLLGTPLHALAKKAVTEEWNITADKITRYDQPRSIIAEGNIVLIKRIKLPPTPPKKKTKGTDWSVLLGEQKKEEPITPKELAAAQKPRYQTETTIKADWMAYDITLGKIKLRGHVDIQSGDDRLYADQGEVNISRDTGTFKNATIVRKQNQLHVEGKTIEKTGPSTYRVLDGWIITCKVDKGQKPPWSLSSKDTKITKGGYAIMKNAKFNVKDVPIFYSPVMILPVKNTRETGFLFPELSKSRNNGFGFDIPFFYNISESADMTFYSAYYSNRGFMPGIQFRYVINPDNKGTFEASYLKDDLSDPSNTSYYNRTGFTHTNDDRYWIRGKLDRTFGNGWITRLDLDIVSDRDYLTEFNSGAYTGFWQTHKDFLHEFGRGFQNNTSDQRNNELNVLKAWSGMSLVTSLVAIDDVRTNKTSPTPLWQLPSVDFSGAMPIADSNFTVNWDSSYVDYWRKDGVGAHRIDLYPKISAPIPLGSYLESRAEVGLRETAYDVQTYGDGTWDQGNTPTRTLYSIHTELGTTLARDFDIPMGGYNGINHKMRPLIQYDFVPNVDQDNLPSFDSIDRINPENTITYGVDNFFTLFKNADDPDSGLDYSYLKIKQSYYLANVRENISEDSNSNPLPSDETDKSFSPVNVKFGWNPIRHVDIVYKTDYDIYGLGFIRHSIEGSYVNSKNDLYDIEYEYDKLTDIKQINLHAKTYLWTNIIGEILLVRSISTSKNNEENLSITYLSPCWSVELRTTKTPTDSAFYLIFNLANVSSHLGVSL